MAYYESVLVFRQDLTEPQVKDKAAKFTEIIKEWVAILNPQNSGD